VIHDRHLLFGISEVDEHQLIGAEWLPMQVSSNLMLLSTD